MLTPISSSTINSVVRIDLFPNLLCQAQLFPSVVAIRLDFRLRTSTVAPLTSGGGEAGEAVRRPRECRK